MPEIAQSPQPKILILATLAGGYAGADSTGQSHLDYPANAYILVLATCFIRQLFGKYR